MIYISVFTLSENAFELIIFSMCMKQRNDDIPTTSHSFYLLIDIWTLPYIIIY